MPTRCNQIGALNAVVSPRGDARQTINADPPLPSKADFLSGSFDPQSVSPPTMLDLKLQAVSILLEELPATKYLSDPYPRRRYRLPPTLLLSKAY